MASMPSAPDSKRADSPPIPLLQSTRRPEAWAVSWPWARVRELPASRLKRAMVRRASSMSESLSTPGSTE